MLKHTSQHAVKGLNNSQHAVKHPEYSGSLRRLQQAQQAQRYLPGYSRKIPQVVPFRQVVGGRHSVPKLPNRFSAKIAAYFEDTVASAGDKTFHRLYTIIRSHFWPRLQGIGGAGAGTTTPARTCSASKARLPKGSPRPRMPAKPEFHVVSGKSVLK